MAMTTPGTVQLIKLGIAFSLHPYTYDPDAPRIGLHAAISLGLAPAQTFKTLMAEVDRRPVCAVIPSDSELSLKKLASCYEGKSAAMMSVPDAERLTGYRVGGIGPFGQKRPVPTAFEETAALHEVIYVNAGQRGLLVGIAPADAIRAAAARAADLVA